MAELKKIAVTTLENEGWTLKKSPDHHGLAMVYLATRNDEQKLMAIRTTKNVDDGISFVPYENGKRWKTLTENDHQAAPDEIVVISANDPTKVYVFNGAEVRKKYETEYDRRVSDGKQPQAGRGFWIPLRNFPTNRVELSVDTINVPAQSGKKIADVVKKAREMVAEAAGVEIEHVNLSVDWSG
ncbi:MAG: hypothetical protein L3J33_08710 [Rhodobacteraceae bacterium]|nr:hypothetical protein [Paracoccaceae bacterium]